MADLAADRPDRPPTHPGAIWREDILPALGLTVSPEMALRFARLCGDDALAGLWLRMQAAYALWHASRHVELDDTPVRAAVTA